MRSAQEALLLVLVAHGTQVSTDDLEIGILAHIIDRHLEHPEMEIGDWAKGAACDENDRLLGGVAQGAVKPVCREGV